MNAYRTKQPGAFAPSEKEPTLLNGKSTVVNQSGKQLVDFLIARKQMQIAVQRHTSNEPHK
jgi:hypothetical protein